MVSTTGPSAGAAPGKNPPLCGKSWQVATFLCSSSCAILIGIFKQLTDTVKAMFVEAD